MLVCHLILEEEPVKRSRALLLAVVPMTLLATTLTACSSAANITEDATGVACAPAGDASNGLKFSGDTFSALEISSEVPVTATSLERTVIETGSGDVFADGATVNLAYNLYNGSTGELIEQQAGIETQNSQAMLEGVGWVYEAIRCATPDQQVAIVVSASEFFGGDPAESGVPDLTADDSMIALFDFTPEEEVKLLDGPDGKKVDLPKGFPTVTTEEDGSPKITIPEGLEAPTSLSIATIIEGDGAEVQPGDRVYVNYRGVIWSTGEEFDSSWGRGEPTDFVTTQVIGGFQQALEGQKVGSQIISVVPAEDGGYGAASLEQMGQEPDAVMVFVLDILGVAPAA